MKLIYRGFLISLISVALFLGACEHKSNKATINVSKQCDSCCLNKLALFVDTLNIDTSKTFDYYVGDKKFTLGNCNLKKFRGNESLKSSLILFWLKVDNVYLKHNWRYSYVEQMGSSKLWMQLVTEFYFLYFNKDQQSIEYLSPAWVNSIITKDPSLLNNSQIKKLYYENKRFKSPITRKSPQ